MPVDREKVAATMAPCDSYSGWAAKYLRGDFDFRDLWNEVKGTDVPNETQTPPGPEETGFALNPGPEDAEVPDEVTPVAEGAIEDVPGPNG